VQRAGEGGKVLILDSAGALHMVQDNPMVAGTGVISWNQTPFESGSKFTSMPATIPNVDGDPSHHIGIIGQNNGIVREFDMDSGTLYAGTTVLNGATVYDPTLDVSGGATMINRAVVVTTGVATGNGVIAQLCVPFGQGPAATAGGVFCNVMNGDADCNYPSDFTGTFSQCWFGSCDGSGACFAIAPYTNGCTPSPCVPDVTGFCTVGTCQPPDGFAVDDGNNCTCYHTNANASGQCLTTGNNDVCLNHHVFNDAYANCTCANPGDRACAIGTTCCGSTNGGCVNLMTSQHHCGGCNIDCGTGTCKNGLCSQSTSCTMPSNADLTAAASNLVGASALTYEQTAGNVCSAFVSTYRSPTTTSSIRKVDKGGTVTTYANVSTTDYTPLVGVAVPQAGDQAFGAFAPNAVVFSHAFTTGTAPPAAVCTDWNNFRAQLGGTSYDYVTIKGSLDTTGVTCNVAASATSICNALKSGTATSILCNARTWRVGTCGTGIEINADNTVCACDASPGYDVRPCGGASSNNANWGGANSATCTPPSQTLTVICHTASAPGMGLVQPLPSTLSNALAAGATNNLGVGPFTDSRFNEGPIGPAFDYVTYAGTNTTRHLYFGNWQVSGDLYHISFPTTTWSAAAVSYTGNSGNERVSAIAFERRWYKAISPHTKDRNIYLAHGHTLSLINLDHAGQTDVNIDGTLLKNDGEGTIVSIISIAVHPIFGDIYLEVIDSNNLHWILEVGDDDLTPHNEIDVAVARNLGNGAITGSFSNDGRIVMDPQFNILRIVPTIDGTPSFTTYTATSQ
jgi:hypothetical protein